MEHPSLELIERLAITTVSGSEFQGDDFHDELEEHLLWCAPCLELFEEEIAAVERIRTAIAFFRILRLVNDPSEVLATDTDDSNSEAWGLQTVASA